MLRIEHNNKLTSCVLASTHRIIRKDVSQIVGVCVIPVVGVLHKRFHGIRDGLDDQAGREDEDPDPVVCLQPLAKEGNGEKPTPDDWCAPDQDVDWGDKLTELTVVFYVHEPRAS